MLGRFLQTALAAMLVLVQFFSQALAQPAIWEAALGATIRETAGPLGLDNEDDDTIDITFESLGNFAFPFNGTTYMDTGILNVSSNGFLSLGGSNGNGCNSDMPPDCAGDPAALVDGTYPRIAPFWTDLNPGPGGGGDIYLNTFNDDDDPDTDRIAITFVSGFHDCANDTCSVQVQVQLLEDGTVIFGYNGIAQTVSQNAAILVGLSPGGGVMDPGNTDFSSSLPLDSGMEPTVYQLFPSVPPPAFDLGDTNLVFVPNGAGGYDIDDTLVDPPASTEPPVWESALGATIRGAVAGLDNVDDGTVTLTFGSFAFPYMFSGVTHIYTGGDILNVSSNGFLSLGGPNGDGCFLGDCGGNPQLLTGDPFPRIAPFWTDLDPGGEGGDVFFNRFDDDADPDIDRIVITFATGFHDCADAECASLAQVQLEEDGTITFGYNGIRQTNSQTSNILVGVSPGGGALDPGSINLSASNGLNTDDVPTVYELFVASSPPPFDLDGGNVVLKPNGQGGFNVTTPGIGVVSAGGGGGGGGGGGCTLGTGATADPLFPALLTALLGWRLYRRRLSPAASPWVARRAGAGAGGTPTARPRDCSS